jgi:copper chaperone
MAGKGYRECASGCVDRSGDHTEWNTDTMPASIRHSRPGPRRLERVREAGARPPPYGWGKAGFASAAMAFSSVSVVGNSLRLRRWAWLTGTILATITTQEMIMATATLKVQGMTCQHCVRTVRDTLEAQDGVERADVDLTGGRATVEYDAALVTPRDLAAAVSDEGYMAEEAT